MVTTFANPALLGLAEVEAVTKATTSPTANCVALEAEAPEVHFRDTGRQRYERPYDGHQPARK